MKYYQIKYFDTIGKNLGNFHEKIINGIDLKQLEIIAESEGIKITERKLLSE